MDVLTLVLIFLFVLAAAVDGRLGWVALALATLLGRL